MDYKQIIAKIESKQFEKIYFLHGEEGFFIDKITDAIIENALEDHERDFNQTIVYGKDSEVKSIISEAKVYPTMAERRLVIVKEAQDLKSIENLVSYFEKPSEQTIFVLNYRNKNFDSRKKVFKAAKQNGLVFKSEKIKEYRLTDWIISYVKSSGYGITPKAGMLLAESLGNDLNRIVNELTKLQILVEKGTTINDIHIEENIGISKDYNLFELGNAVSIRDVSKANQIVDYFYHNPKAGPLVPVVSNLFGHFSKLMRIHFLPDKSKESVTKALKVHPFVASLLISSSEIYNRKKVASNIAVLHQYDLKSKGVGNATATGGELMKELIYQLMH